jgi:hypothetical protein
MEVIQRRRPVDVFGIARQRRDPPVERLPELSDHGGLIGVAGRERREQSVTSQDGLDGPYRAWLLQHRLSRGMVRGPFIW